MSLLGDAADLLEDAAAEMVATRLHGADIAWPDGLPCTEAMAYRLQSLRLPLLEGAGFGRPVGHKIGATTPSMRAMLGLDAPCSGRLLKSGVTESGGTFTSSRLVGVECEIVVWLSSDLPCASGECSLDDAQAAVGSCSVAIEIVENRYGDFRASGAPLLIADDFFAAGCVLGTQHHDLDPRRLDEVDGDIYVNDELRSQGRGADLMGHPLEALRWLAAASAFRNQPLRRGEFILLGSLTEPQWLKPGDAVRATAGPFGDVTLQLAS